MVARALGPRIAVLLAVAAAAGCGPRHIQPYTPRERQWEPPEYAAQESERAAGSLWSQATPSLFEDHRSRRVGDIVVILLEESASASGDASTSLTRQGEWTSQITGLLGLLDTIQEAVPNVDFSNLLGMSNDAEFEGDGQTERSNRVSGTLAVHVRRVLPNGDLYIEGNKVIMINNEELHLYVSGVVRPVDLAGDNTVPSSRIADAQVELAGRGDLSDHQRPGWLRRILNRVWPL